MSITAINTTLAVLTVIGQVIVIFVVLFLVVRRLPHRNAILNLIRGNALTAAFVTALVSMLGKPQHQRFGVGVHPPIISSISSLWITTDKFN